MEEIANAISHFPDSGVDAARRLAREDGLSALLSNHFGWMRARLSFAILCLRGSRTKWRSAFGMDGCLNVMLKYFMSLSFFKSVILLLYCPIRLIEYHFVAEAGFTEGVSSCIC